MGYYVLALMGRVFQRLRIELARDNALGRAVVAEVRADDLSADYVQVPGRERSLHGTRMLCRDGTGGDLRLEDSACPRMDAAGIDWAEREFATFAERGIDLGAPEVPLDARQELLGTCVDLCLSRCGPRRVRGDRWTAGAVAH